MITSLYLQAYLDEGNNDLELDPISKCAILLTKYPRKLENVVITLIINSNIDLKSKNFDTINYLKHLGYSVNILESKNLEDDLKCVDLPVVLCEDTLIIYSGVAAVFRRLVQNGYMPKEKIPLFGVAQSCLKSCKERSKWTLICESAVIEFIKQFHEGNCEELKILYDLNLSFNMVKSVPNGFNNVLPDKWHQYLEGTKKTISDVIIWYYLTEYSRISNNFLEAIKQFNKLNEWLDLVSKDNLSDCVDEIHELKVKWGSCYESSVRLTKNVNHNFSVVTGLEKLDKSAKNMTQLKEVVMNENLQSLKLELSQLNDNSFDWQSVNEYLRPDNSFIPKARQMKKSNQLINMVKCAEQFIEPGSTIVDFCSGGGHLGLTMASIYPECKVILLENKEESLMMAEERVRQSKLSNIKLYKCNVFAFQGHFHLGMALHACGTVTDLVIEICQSRKANMVICPCCYGGISPSPNITYPRSKTFNEVAIDDYSILCHAAECADGRKIRVELGKEAMQIIDSDRVRFLRENNYLVNLFKMIPEDCTPKNHIIVSQYLQ